MLNRNDMDDNSPCTIHSDQTTTRTHQKFDTDENISKCSNRINHHNCNDKCNFKNFNNTNEMGLSGNLKHIPKYSHKFGLHYTQFCVLVLVAFISFTHSAPTTTTHHHQVRHRREGKLIDWTRPCPIMSQNDSNEYNATQMQKIFNVIASECLTALQNANLHVKKFLKIRWKDLDANVTESNIIEKITSTWTEDGAWLHPENNKKFNYNEDIPSDIQKTIESQLKQLNEQDSERLLIDMYERFMRIAYGIEIIMEEHDKNTIYQDNQNYELNHIYEKLQQDLQLILCEINEGITLLKLKPEPPARFHPDILKTKKIVRDWVIYREYLSLLRFISEVYK